MAGSYRHCIADDGKLLDNEAFVGMIENLGDAYEAVEEMYGMIWWLANRIAEGRSDRRRYSSRMVAQAERYYKHGIVQSPGVRSSA